MVTITDPSKWKIGTPNALEATLPRENLQPSRILRRSPKNSASSSTSPRALSDDKNRGGEGLIYSTPLQAGDILPLDVFGPEGSKRATSGDSVEDPSHAGARSQTDSGTPVGEAEMNPADNISHLRTQLGDGVPEKLTLMQEPDDKHKKVNSHHSKETGESSAALSPLPSDAAEPGTTAPPRNPQGKKVMQSQDDVGAATLWNLTEAVAGGPEQFWLQINEEISRINFAIAEFSADRASTHASAAIIELSAAFEKVNCQLGSAEEEAVNLKAAAKTAIAELRALYDELVAENDILRQEIEEREKRATVSSRTRMDPPIEGVDGGSDPPLAYGLRAPPRAADPAEDMQAMQREPGGAQPRDERPADTYLTGSGIAAPAAPEPLDTTRVPAGAPPTIRPLLAFRAADGRGV